MKKDKAGLVLLAGGICMVGVVALLGGMSFYAGKEGNRQEQITEEEETETEGMSDVIEEVLAEQETEKESGAVKLVTGEENNYLMVPLGNSATEMAYAKVPILTWDEFYALSPGGGEQNITGDGIYGILSENELSMEEAGKIGLEEMYRVFGDHMEEKMYLVMRLCNAEEGGKKVDTWSGYLTNMFNGMELEKGWSRMIYFFDLNAVTGEVLYLDGKTYIDGVEKSGEELSEEELLQMANGYVENYGLAELEELQGERADEQIARWGNSMYLAQIAYYKNDELYLGIALDKYSGEFVGYMYYDYVSF